MRRALLLALTLAMAACAYPSTEWPSSMTRWDKDTEYAVVPRPDGFTLTVRYERFQFFPAPGAVASDCKSAVTSLAYELAQRDGKAIQPVNEQRIRLSVASRLGGITACGATVPVDYATDRGR